MAIDFKLPELGENVRSADVARVLVREGDVVAPNTPILELETEKAVIEIPCSIAGTITKVHVSKGQTIQVGQVLLTLEPPVNAATTPATPVETTPTAAPVTATPTTMPQTASTEKTPAEPESPIAAGPESRRLARELGVDLSQVRGTGPNDRITPDDVRTAVAQLAATSPFTAQKPAAAPSAATEPPAAYAPVAGGREPAVPPGELSQDAYGPIRRERMSRIRRTIAAQMVKSVTKIPHVTNFDDADITDLEQIRKSVPQAYVGPAVKLTAMAFVMKAVALSLRQNPLLNASLDEETEEIIYKQYVHLGVAVDTPRGLVVPVVRNVDQMGVLQIARELTILAARARASEFSLDDLRGGTFTLSNLGAVGGTYSTPIINHPEVAILLLGRSRWVLGVRDGKVEGRLMLPLSLSYDHRVIDGAAAGRFLNSVIDYLQTPGKLLLTA